MNHSIFFGFVLAVSSGAALAQDSSFGAGLGLSTFGPTLEGTYRIQPNLGVRGVAFVPLSGDLNDVEVADDFEIDGDVSTGAFALMADYYPTGQGWRISGGLFFASDDLVSGTVTDTTSGDTFSGSLSMKEEVAPIITGGYTHVFRNNVYLSGEIGAIFSGFEATSNSTDADVIADIAEINGELDDLPAYPYIAVTLGFSF